jgi:hypothetical protein
MILEFAQKVDSEHDGDQKKKTHTEAWHKMHDEACSALGEIDHGVHKVHLNHTLHRAEKGAKGLAGSAKHEIKGTVTNEDKQRYEALAKAVADSFLPHLEIGRVDP